jgi:hypothetical protein
VQAGSVVAMSHRSTAYLIEISARITVRPVGASEPDCIAGETGVRAYTNPTGAEPRKQGRLSFKPKILELGQVD